MFTDMVKNVSKEMGINKPKVSVVDGGAVGCSDAQLIKFTLNGKSEEILVYKTDFSDSLKLEQKIRRGLQKIYS